MKLCLVPFSGGVNSLYCLLWTRNLPVKPVLYYIRNLFAHNGSPEEVKSVQVYLKGLRNVEDNHFFSQPELTSVKTPWALIEGTTSITFTDKSSGFAYLAEQCAQVAHDHKIDTIVWDHSCAPVDTLSTLEKKYGVNFIYPSASNNRLDSIRELYENVMYEHTECTEHGETKQYVGAFDVDFPFWQSLWCCSRPANEQEIDMDDQLPNLCQMCRRCQDVRAFLESNVEEFISVTSPHLFACHESPTRDNNNNKPCKKRRLL